METIIDFRKKWGVRTPRQLVERLIQDAPEFPIKEKLAIVIRELIDDLENVLGKLP